MKNQWKTGDFSRKFRNLIKNNYYDLLKRDIIREFVFKNLLRDIYFEPCIFNSFTLFNWVDDKSNFLKKFLVLSSRVSGNFEIFHRGKNFQRISYSSPQIIVSQMKFNSCNSKFHQNYFMKSQNNANISIYSRTISCFESFFKPFTNYQKCLYILIYSQKIELHPATTSKKSCSWSHHSIWNRKSLN